MNFTDEFVCSPANCADETIFTSALALGLAVGTLVPAFAQSSTDAAEKSDRNRVCHTMGNLDRLLHQDPKMAQRMSVIEKQTQSYVESVGESCDEIADGEFIPVVFHVLYNTAAENISEAQVLSQSRIMNDDFRRLNADQDNVWAQAADTQIEFCLATQDPDGTPWMASCALRPTLLRLVPTTR